MKFPRKPLRPVSKRLIGAGLAVASVCWLLTPDWLFTPSCSDAHAQGSIDSALSCALREKAQLVVDPESVPHWVDSPERSSAWPWQTTEAIILARPPDQVARDLYWVRTQISGQGELLKLVSVHNLTQTSAADESGLTGFESHIAWQLGDSKQIYRVEYAELHGAPHNTQPPHQATWGKLARLQRTLTVWQETGQMKAITRRSFKLEPVAKHLDLSFTRGEASQSELSIVADDRITRLPLNGGAAIEGARYVLEQFRIAARPSSLVPWAVDRFRALPWFGSDRMQWVKAIAYKVRDWFGERSQGNAEKPWQLANALDAVPAPRTQPQPASAPVMGSAPWPPSPVPTVVEPSLQGEGQWRSPTQTAFLRHSPGLAPPFATTFVRPDEERLDSRVLIVLWDPRRVALDFVAGTREPKSATGEIGTGVVPQDPSLIPRLIGAFNGAFQTSHGNWGAQANNKLYVPPQPYAATVARYKDGAVGFGTWPLDTSIPPAIQAFRQNLTPLVSDSQFNQYRRTWWGGVPNGWTDDTRTVRSGICETNDRHVGYFYGIRVDHEHLARAMMLTRCRYGIHLDMNQGHTGFEFYSVSRSLPVLPDDSLDNNWQAQGSVPNFPELKFRSRKLFREMPLMNFPRYVHRQTRDFFYLTERPTLSTERLTSAFPLAAHEGVWSLPIDARDGSPHALATTWLRPDAARPETKIRIVQLDLAWLKARQGQDGERPIVLTLRAPGSTQLSELTSSPAIARNLWLESHRAGISAAVPAGAVVLARQSRHTAPRRTSLGSLSRHRTSPGTSSNHAAWGLLSPQILAYAEVVTGPSPGEDPALLAQVLRSMGCTDVLATANSRMAIQGTTDLAGHPVLNKPGTRPLRLTLVRDEWPATRPLFADTAVVGPEVWYYLQH